MLGTATLDEEGLRFLRAVDVRHVVSGADPGLPVAAAFDEVLGFVQSLSGRPGMTGTLTVRYRKPTPLHTELRFDAQLVLYGTDPSEILWSLDLWGQVVAGGGKAAPQDPALRAQAAALQFVKEAIGRLPRRSQE